MQANLLHRRGTTPEELYLDFLGNMNKAPLF
jgi:hypothetical protein